jgi:perosamine synthetase
MRSSRSRQPKRIVPASRPRIGQEEIRKVSEALHAGWVSSRGPFLDDFERRFCAFVGGHYGIATSSGTTALHLALATLGIGPGDEVIVPDFTMVACVDAVLYTGARPVFVDVSSTTWTLDPEQTSRAVTPKTRAIMPVHLYGHPADMDPVQRLAREHGLAIVEDAAEAHGATYKGKMVGSLGELGCFSFYSNKLMTTGEGGIVIARARSMATRARLLRDLAFAHATRDYRHSEMAFNYRLTNIQAALGLAQLHRLPEAVQHRRKCARTYGALLEGVPGLELPREAPWAKSVFWMYTVRISGGERRRRAIVKALGKRGIDARVGFWPLHKQPFCKPYSSTGQTFPISDRLGSETLSLPSGNGITLSEVRYVANALRDVMAG